MSFKSATGTIKVKLKAANVNVTSSGARISNPCFLAHLSTPVVLPLYTLASIRIQSPDISCSNSASPPLHLNQAGCPYNHTIAWVNQLSHSARQRACDNWAGSASSLQLYIRLLCLPLDAGLFLWLSYVAGLLLLWIKNVSLSLNESADWLQRPPPAHAPQHGYQGTSEGHFLPGRRPSFWCISGHLTPALNTWGSVQTAHLGCLWPVQFQTQRSI